MVNFGFQPLRVACGGSYVLKNLVFACLAVTFVVGCGSPDAVKAYSLLEGPIDEVAKVVAPENSASTLVIDTFGQGSPYHDCGISDSEMIPYEETYLIKLDHTRRDSPLRAKCLIDRSRPYVAVSLIYSYHGVKEYSREVDVLEYLLWSPSFHLLGADGQNALLCHTKRLISSVALEDNLARRLNSKIADQVCPQRGS